MVESSFVERDLRTPQFNGTYYDFWTVKMETILLTYDLWDVVEVILHQPHQNPKTNGESAVEGSEIEHILEETHIALIENGIMNVKALSLIQGALFDDLFPRIKNEKKTIKGAERS